MTEMNKKGEPLTVKDEQKQLLKREIRTLPLVKDVGVADVSSYKKIQGGSTPYEFLPDAKTAIVYIAKTEDVLHTYGKWYVVSLNHFLKQTNDRIITVLNRHGLHGCGVIDEGTKGDLIGKISFRQLAVLAGLGTIGKNTCLLHPVYGARVVIGVVLTDSKIQNDNPLDAELCTDCALCLRKCLPGAIKKDCFDRHVCKNRRRLLGKGCGTPCIDLCPVGSRGKL